MPPPYLAIATRGDGAGGAPPPGLSARLAASGWAPRLARPGLQLFSRPERPLAVETFAAGDGVLIGRWFGPRPLRHDGDPARTARALCGSGWGPYLALLPEAATGAWRVFREPSGAVEAFTWRCGDLAVLASGLADLPPELLPHDLGLDWDAVADFLVRPASLLWRTALRGVSGVCPGDLQRLGEGTARAVAVWRPADRIPAGAGAGPVAPEPLAETLQAATAALAAPYRRIAAEASGGLDSSAVNAALVRAGLGGRVVGALHYVGDRREADERAWAQAACGPWGLPLVCADRGEGAFDPVADFAELARDARPPYAALDAVRDRDTARRLRDWGAEALVTGKGGDAVFFQMPTPLVLADLWRAKGLAAAADPLNAQVARWLRRSVWSVWREAFGGGPAAEESPVGRFAGWALRGAAGPVHPWLRGLEDAPPGKRIQVEALVGGQAALGPSRRGGAADLVQPLLSQPMLELGLSIPSWELVRGGRDRGLAREAFAAWLPEAVVRRRSKGALTSVYARRAAASLPALREHLLDGVLASAGLLDRAAMDAALDADELIRRSDGLDLLQAAAVETWVRCWQTKVPDARGAARPRRRALVA